MSINVIGERTIVERDYVKVEIPEILQGLMCHFYIDANLKDVKRDTHSGDYYGTKEEVCPGSHPSYVIRKSVIKKLELTETQKIVMDSIFNLYSCYCKEDND